MTDRLAEIVALHRAGRTREAEAGYRACLADGVDEAGAPLAALLLQQGRFAEATDVLEPLVRAAPGDGALAVNLSVALRNGGRVAEALQAAERACAADPARMSAWNAYGVAALELDRPLDALRAFDSGLAVAPAHPVLTLHRAHALRRCGRNREALPIYLEAVRRDPALLDAWRGLAQAQGALGQLDVALQSRARALALAPHDSEVAFEHAVAQLHAGDAAAAARAFESLLRVRPDDARLRAWLGRARIKLGDVDGARSEFEQARALDAEDPVIAHYHAALSGEFPQGSESAYVRALFDGFADRFERTLTVNLGYDTPAKLVDLLRRHGADAGAEVLDLGCGTGLMAQQLARPGRAIDGIDLSPRMLEHAREKNLYRELHAAELLEFLHAAQRRWDLIVAADVFVYVPDLPPVFAAARACVGPGGALAFSIERSSGAAAELPPQTGRYRQAPAAVLQSLRDAGFATVAHEPTVLRFESGQPVAGELFVACVGAS